MKKLCMYLRNVCKSLKDYKTCSVLTACVYYDQHLLWNQFFNKKIIILNILFFFISHIFVGI